MTTRQRSIIGVDRNNFGRVLAWANNAYRAMSATPKVYNPTAPTLADFLVLILALAKAQEPFESKDGKKAPPLGAAAERDQARDALWSAMEAMVTYVQGLADAKPESALATIHGAGMKEAMGTARAKPPVEAVVLAGKGIVRVRVNRKFFAGRATNVTTHYYVSADGTSWQLAKSTHYAQWDIPNLPLNKDAYFRVAVDVGDVEGTPTDAIKASVH